MNPELQRNLWLEATPRRIAWVLVALTLVLGAVGIITGMSGAGGENIGQALGITGAAIFVLSAYLWGSREASQSVMEEIGARTWEFQRLSALTPWSMTWGKLFGAPSVAWLAALVGLTFAAADAGARNGAASAAWMVIAGVALGVVFHATAMSSALIGVRKARAEGRLTTLRGGVFGLLLVLFLLWQLVGFLGIRGDFGLISGLDGSPAVRWWGGSYGRAPFFAISAVLLAMWVVAGAWRLLRLELQTRNAAWWWPAFLTFVAIWAAGLTEGTAERWLAAFGVFGVGTYLAAFAEPADRIRLRQFASSALRPDVERTLTLTPAALPALLLTAIAALGVTLSSGGADAVGLGGEGLREGLTRSTGLAFAALAFLVRDLGLIAFFRFGARPRRGDFGAVVALGVLYLAGGALGQAVGGDIGGALFFPNPAEPIVSLISAAVQAFLIWTLAARRIAGPDRPSVAT